LVVLSHPARTAAGTADRGQIWSSSSAATSPHRAALRCVPSEALIQEYLRCYRLPGTIQAICEDYRAAASIDLEHDAVDDGRRLEMPLLALWGARGVVGQLYDVLATWREKAAHVQGRALDCGHSPQEEAAEQTADALVEFLRAAR